MYIGKWWIFPALSGESSRGRWKNFPEQFQRWWIIPELNSFVFRLVQKGKDFPEKIAKFFKKYSKNNTKLRKMVKKLWKLYFLQKKLKKSRKWWVFPKKRPKNKILKVILKVNITKIRLKRWFFGKKNQNVREKYFT